MTIVDRFYRPFRRLTYGPKGQIVLATASNGLNAASKAIFLSAASHLVTGEVFDPFILIVVIVDAASIILDLGGAAGLIITARDVPKEELPHFYRRAQIFKLAYLLVAILVLQFFWGQLAALSIFAVCVFEFQNIGLQSRYRFQNLFLRQLFGFSIRLAGILPFYLYGADSSLLLFLFYLPQILIGVISFIITLFADCQKVSWRETAQKGIAEIEKYTGLAVTAFLCRLLSLFCAAATSLLLPFSWEPVLRPRLVFYSHFLLFYQC